MSELFDDAPKRAQTVHRTRSTAIRGERAQAWVLVGVFLLLVNGTDALYWAADLELSAGLRLLVQVLAIVVFWRLLEAECRPYRLTFPLDIAYFLYATSFMVLPYYLWKTQRWRGMRKLLLLAGLWAGSYGLGAGIAWLLGMSEAGAGAAPEE